MLCLRPPACASESQRSRRRDAASASPNDPQTDRPRCGKAIHSRELDQRLLGQVRCLSDIPLPHCQQRAKGEHFTKPGEVVAAAPALFRPLEQWLHLGQDRWCELIRGRAKHQDVGIRKAECRGSVEDGLWQLREPAL